MKLTKNKYLLTLLAIIGVFSAVTLENAEIKAKPKEDEFNTNN